MKNKALPLSIRKYLVTSRYIESTMPDPYLRRTSKNNSTVSMSNHCWAHTLYEHDCKPVKNVSLHNCNTTPKIHTAKQIKAAQHCCIKRGRAPNTKKNQASMQPKSALYLHPAVIACSLWHTIHPRFILLFAPRHFESAAALHVVFSSALWGP